MTLAMKVTHRDKSQMVETLQQFKTNPPQVVDAALRDATSLEDWKSGISPRYAHEDTNGPDWFTFEKPVLYV